MAQNRHAASVPLFGSQSSASVVTPPADRASARSIIASQKTARHCAVMLHWWRRTGMPLLHHRFYHSLARYMESSKVEGGSVVG